VRPRAVPPPEQSHSTQVDDDLSIDADANDDVSCASDSFDEDSTDDLPVGGTVDMDDAVRSTSTSSWSLRNLEGVMVGASWPLRQVAREVSQWSSSSFDDDDECDNTKRPMGRAIAYPASVDTDDVGKDDGEASETKRDEKKRTAGANGSRAEWTAWLSPSKWTATQLGWAARDKVNAVAAERRRDVRDETRTDRTGGSRIEEKKNNSKKTKKTKTKTDWRAAAASWIAEDDMETFFLSEPDPLGFGAFFTGVNAWAAGRLERSRASVWANSRPPALEIVNLSHADKARLGLGCDEMHFLPVPNSGWSIALLRYKAKAFDCRTDHVTWTTPCITSPDSMWDDSDFVKGAGGSHHEKVRPCAFPKSDTHCFTSNAGHGSDLSLVTVVHTSSNTRPIHAQHGTDTYRVTTKDAVSFRPRLRVERVHVRRVREKLFSTKTSKGRPRRVDRGVPGRGVRAALAIAWAVGGQRRHPEGKDCISPNPSDCLLTQD